MYWPYYFAVNNQPIPYFYNPFMIEHVQNTPFNYKHQIPEIRASTNPEMDSGNSLHSDEQRNNTIELTLTKDDLLAAGYQVGRSSWTEQQDDKLLSLTSQNLLNWKQIAESISGRNQKMCYSRYRRLISSNRQKWKKQQDELILKLVDKYKFNWKIIATHFQNRSAKLIKEHYTNHLAQNVNKECWKLEEDLLLIKLLNKQGKNWRLISQKMDGRTVTQLKNRYFGRLKRLQQKKTIKSAVQKNK